MFVGPSVQYIVDFAPQLSEIILESKYLEQAGFSVPELARNVALQVWLLLIVMSYMFYFVGLLKVICLNQARRSKNESGGAEPYIPYIYSIYIFHIYIPYIYSIYSSNDRKKIII